MKTGFVWMVVLAVVSGLWFVSASCELGGGGGGGGGDDDTDDAWGDDDETDDDAGDDDAGGEDWCPSYSGSDLCCKDGNPCNKDGNGACDCDALCAWDVADCSADDDSTDDDATDDDFGDDDTWADDDDDDDWTCSEIADGMVNSCGMTLVDADSSAQDEVGLIQWCGLSEDLYGKSDAVFWECMGRCVFAEDCDDGCFDECLDPSGPASGCGHVVDELYGCDVVFLFSGTRFWIPEMDLQETCDAFSDPWSCYHDCVNDECDGGANQGQRLIDCMTSNCAGGDDDATDDDDDDWSCSGIADGMVNTCAMTLLDGDGVQQDESGLTEWCWLSEDLYAKSDAAFWNCMGGCVFDEFCDEGCFEDCLAPGDPGSGCGHTVHGIYGCDVVFLFTDTRYWIPELDMQQTCESFSDPWDCYQTCVDDECDGSGGQGTALINCLNANCS